jgi:hypothetical protein
MDKKKEIEIEIGSNLSIVLIALIVAALMLLGKC